MIPTVQHIFICPRRGDPMRELPTVRAVANGGLVGDRWYRSPWTLPLRMLNAWRKGERFRIGATNLTIISLEDIEAGNALLPVAFSPLEMRRNIVIDGSLSLNSMLGARIQIGSVVVVGDNLCTPCGFPPMRAKNGCPPKDFNRAFGHPNPIFGGGVNRGGIRCRIVKGGIITIGDTIELTPRPLTL